MWKYIADMVDDLKVALSVVLIVLTLALVAHFGLEDGVRGLLAGTVDLVGAMIGAVIP